MTDQFSFLGAETPSPIEWQPTRQAGLARLSKFVPAAGRAYAATRNSDLGPDQRTNVSALSPWVRHRLVLEEDILRATFAKHSYSASEKFTQEVFWRGYFKGWLEHRPEVWERYKRAVVTLVDALQTDASLEARYAEAIEGRTGIACFDAWAKELIDTGYLHNHARMWFASIWIFTLELPWELGADFFYRNLLDGDPAANTCSWRWVGGLHTAGKTYLARASNIERFTDGRFNPHGQLSAQAIPLEEAPLAGPVAPVFESLPELSGNVGLLITEEDCASETLVLSQPPVAIAALTNQTARSVLSLGAHVARFAPAAVEDAANRAGARFQIEPTLISDEDWAAALTDWAKAQSLSTLITARAPIGPVQRRLQQAETHLAEEGIQLFQVTRDYDRAVWPHARKGFFGMKKKMPRILEELSLA